MVGATNKKPRAGPGANERKSQRFCLGGLDAIDSARVTGGSGDLETGWPRPRDEARRKLRQQVPNEKPADLDAVQHHGDLVVRAKLLPLTVVGLSSGTRGIGVDLEPTPNQVGDPVNRDAGAGIDP